MELNAKANSFSPLTQEHAMLFKRKSRSGDGWRKIQSCRVLRCTRYQKKCGSLWDCRQFMKPPCTAQSQVKFSSKRDPYVFRSRVEEGCWNPNGQYDARRPVTGKQSSERLHLAGPHGLVTVDSGALGLENDRETQVKAPPTVFPEMGIR